jgi:hypothetical protein
MRKNESTRETEGEYKNDFFSLYYKKIMGEFLILKNIRLFPSNC